MSACWLSFVCRRGIRLDTNRLNPGEVTKREGFPVTTTARTILDEAARRIAEEQIREAGHEAIRRCLADRGELQAIASRRGGRSLRIIEKILDIETE